MKVLTISILKRMAPLYRAYRDNVWFTYDYKTPSSLAEKSMEFRYIQSVYRRQDLIKFVVGSVRGFGLYASSLIEHPTKAQIYVSPCGEN